ncbi:hypothetical protein [Dactylosporangium sp. NPDC051484]|uniref:hypothetical protein n=1 Tax=Dactylosporangium sp. NPDC051484 TaxID=3154942 RepID=UPI00344DB901
MAVGVAAGIVVGLGGCGGDKPATIPVNAQQPFDIVLGDKVGLIDYAVQRMRDTCMQAAGYPQNLQAIPDRPSNPYQSLTIKAQDFGPVTEDEARRLGFGHDTQGEPPRVVSFDPNYDLNLDRCKKSAEEKLGTDARETRQSYNGLVNDLLAYRREVTDNVPADLPEKTLRCMESKGYTVADRAEFLKKPQPQRFGVKFGVLDSVPEVTWTPPQVPGTVQVGPAIPARKYRPTAEESALAVAWFRCGEETGRIKHMVAAASALQLRYVEKYQDRLGELNPKIEALARNAAALATG